MRPWGLVIEEEDREREKEYTKGTYHLQFYTFKKHTKESLLGDNDKIIILGQEETLQSGEDLITPTKRP